MLVRYFKRPSRIEQLRGSTGGHLLEGFAKELSQGCYQWVAAPYRAFADSNAISILVARAMRRTGIDCPKRGAAQILRHSVASSMLRQGVSLQEIAGVLRHRSIATTEIYAKVDVLTLGQIAQPWPEVKAC